MKNPQQGEAVAQMDFFFIANRFADLYVSRIRT